MPSPPQWIATREETLLGVVDGVTYRHSESQYTVLRVLVAAAEPSPGARPARRAAEEVVHAVGKAVEVAIGGRVSLRGSWRDHPRHGRQFQFHTLEALPPIGRDGVARYLASKNFKGIGPVLAERIVAELGDEALERIDRDPACLARVRGLRRAARDNLVNALRASRGEREFQAFLHGLELNAAQVLEAVRVLGAEREAEVRSNPYVLASTVRGIGFTSADRAARKLGLAEDSPERRRAGLAFALELAVADGHTCIDLAHLRARAEGLLERSLTPEEVEHDADELARAREIVLERELEPGSTLVYPPELATCERELARSVTGLALSGPARPLGDARGLAAAEARARLDLHPAQRAAVKGCLEHSLVLLTGGPGVGKTTIVRLVVELAEQAGCTVALASPTGRAAKRLSEATGRPASTIHRLLGWDPARHRFGHDARTPLGAGLVIVDEISMLDVVLAHHLLKAVQAPTRLVLVGDPDQLPSVAAGNVLADLLASGRVPVFRLNQVYRQRAASLIVENAHRILAGETPRVLGRDDPVGDFYFFPAEDEEQAADRLVEVVTERIPRRFGLAWMDDVQVLSPMYRGACGVDALNERLRRALDAPGAELAWRDSVWRTGDRVIQTRNDYDKQVYNGDMGRIAAVDASAVALTVRFPERDVRYQAQELTDLAPAFAITVHRSQGGEFPAVVLPLVPQHYPMLQRNLLYTAITRARQLVVLIGSQRALARAVANAEPSRRGSGLAQRLRRAASAAGS